MEVLHPHCAGLDVHKDTVVAGVRHMVGGTVRREVQTFKTTTKDLIRDPQSSVYRKGIVPHTTGPSNLDPATIEMFGSFLIVGARVPSHSAEPLPQE